MICMVSGGQHQPAAKQLALRHMQHPVLSSEQSSQTAALHASGLVAKDVIAAKASTAKGAGAAAGAALVCAIKALQRKLPEACSTPRQPSSLAERD